MATACNLNTETEPDLTRFCNVLTATGIGFQIGVAADAALQFVKGLNASPKGVSSFHRLGSACQHVRLRPYQSIIAIVGGACALHKANDNWLGKIEDIRNKQKAVSKKDQSMEGWFYDTAISTGMGIQFGLIGGTAFHFLRGLDGGGFPSLGGAFNAVRHNAPRVAGKFGAWNLLSSTLTYASCVALRTDDSSENISAVANVAAVGLLSARRGLPAAAAFAALAGGMELLFKGIAHYFPECDQRACKLKACKEEGVEEDKQKHG